MVISGYMKSIRDLFENNTGTLYVAGMLIFALSVAFLPKYLPTNETSTEREARFDRCLEVHGTTITHQARMEGEDAGICSGFSDEEIEARK